MIMSRFGTASFWISKKFLNNVGRGILSQSRMHVLKNCPGGFGPKPIHFNIPSYLSLYIPGVGCRDPYLLPIWKKSHQMMI